MAEPWIDIVQRAIPKYERELLDLTKVRRLPLAMLQQRGKVRTGIDASYEATYPVDYRETPTTAFAYGTTAEYSPIAYTKTATRDWRGAMKTDAMHEDEYITFGRGKNTNELVNRYARIVPKNTKAIRDMIADSFYIDGNATGNTGKFRGIETFMGYEAGEVIAADLIAKPDDTYHGLDTSLAQTGTWSTDLSTSPNHDLGSDFPEGSGDREYHYWSPLLVNWSSTSWGTSSAEWEDNVLRVLSRTAMWMRHTQACDGQLLCMMAPNLYSGFRAVLESKVTLMPPHKESERLGFPDALNWEGVAVTTGYGIPADTAYMFDVDGMKLEFLTPKIVKNYGPDFDYHSLSHLFFSVTKGDYKFVPKKVAKISNYA